jgi:hypothetical protein
MMFDAMITPASGWGSAEIAWRICMASAGYSRHCARNDGRSEEPIDRGVVQRKISTELHMAERRKTAARKASRGTVAKKSSAKKSSAKKSSAKKSSPKRWSQRVTKESDALDLKRGVFKLTSAKKIATSLKHSAEHSSRRKSGAYRSALSMLTFYINRAGKTLPKTQRERLERAKEELKHQFGRE